MWPDGGRSVQVLNLAPGPCDAALMTAILVHHSLIDRRRTSPPDKQLERRIWLADRIRRYAEESLGPRFLDVEMVSTPGTPGPSIAVFRFEPWPGGERSADQSDRQQAVAEFVALLDRAKR